MPNCIVCKTPNAKQSVGADIIRFDCERCGSFVLGGTAESVLDGLLDEIPLRRSLMSHTLRRMQLPNDKHLRVIRGDELASFWREDRLPTPLEQADNLILLIGNMQETPSAWAWVSRHLHLRSRRVENEQAALRHESSGNDHWDASKPKEAEDALASMVRATLRGETKQTDD